MTSRRIWILLLGLVLFSGACTHKDEPSAGSPAPTQQPRATESAASPSSETPKEAAVAAAAKFGFTCPDKEHKPLLVVTASPQTKLVVCGYEDSEYVSEDPKRVAANAFKVYRNAQGEPLFVSESEANSFYVSEKNGNQLFIEKWIWTNKEEPLIGTTISCAGEKCSLSKGTCLVKLKKNPYPTIVKDVWARVKSGELDGQPYYDSMIAELLAQALGGDAEAKNLFLTDHASELKVDGASAEMYEEGRRSVKAAQDAGCFGK